MPGSISLSEDDALRGRKLSVGIALTTDPYVTRGLLQQFCLALSDATGMEVEPRGVLHYRSLLDGVAEGDLDLVWLPPIPALDALGSERVEPIALPVRNGMSTYSSALFTLPESPIRTLDDLVGARAAWVDRQSAAGYLIIRAHLRALGVDLTRAFAEEGFAGSHDAVTRAVVEGRADVGATFAYFPSDSDGPTPHPVFGDEGHRASAPSRPEPRHGETGRRAIRAGWGEAEVHVLAEAGPIPSDIVAASTTLPSLVTRLVQSALVDGHHPALMRAARDLLGAESFAAPEAEHLEPLRRLLSRLEGEARPAVSILPPPMPHST